MSKGAIECTQKNRSVLTARDRVIELNAELADRVNGLKEVFSPESLVLSGSLVSIVISHTDVRIPGPGKSSLLQILTTTKDF